MSTAQSNLASIPCYWLYNSLTALVVEVYVMRPQKGFTFPSEPCTVTAVRHPSELSQSQQRCKVISAYRKLAYPTPVTTLTVSATLQSHLSIQKTSLESLGFKA